jgi:hypothetical protein
MNVLKASPESREVEPSSRHKRFSLKDRATSLIESNPSFTATNCRATIEEATAKNSWLLKNCENGLADSTFYLRQFI